MLGQSRKFSMEFFSSDIIRGYGFFSRCKKSKIHSFFSTLYHCAPLAVGVLVHSFFTALIIFSRASITAVLAICSGAYSIPLVVPRLAEFMIYYIWGPFTKYNEMSKAVTKIHFSVNSDLNISKVVFPTCNFIFTSSWASIHSPVQLSCFWIVTKYRPDIRSGKVVARFRGICFLERSHSILLRSGRPEAGWSVGSALLPRLSIANGVGCGNII